MDGEMLEYSEAEDLSISARGNLTESNLSYRQEEENYEDEGPEDLSGYDYALFTHLRGISFCSCSIFVIIAASSCLAEGFL